MTGLCVIGAGGHGRVVADCAIATGMWDKLQFLDDVLEKGTIVAGWPVGGRVSSAAEKLTEYPDFVIALGDNRLRVDLLGEFTSLGFNPVSIVHPRAAVSSTACLGAGCVVMAAAAINCDTVIGAGGIVNTGATVDHDCVLGAGVHVSPGANLAGAVVVGDHSWIGIGASVIQQVHIGHDVVVGAGAAVINDVPDSDTVVGVPARSTVEN